MIFGSVCSGIEAASVAWHPLGWKSAFFSEIEAFPRAVLSHHYPDVPLHGDFTTIKENDYGTIDLLVGGTPCQSFSIAGLRKGLADDRGNLALEFIRLAERKRPRWVVWENVPGALSIDAGRAFGSILGGLAQIGYGFAYRVLDAQYFGVPQRRQRVFVVGHLGSWKRPAAVLFERQSLRGDITPRREKGKVVAAITASGVGTCGADDNQAQAGHLITVDRQSSGEYGTSPVASTVSARDYKGPSDLVCHIDGGDTARTLTARYDSSVTHDRGPNIVAIPLNLQVITRHEALGQATGFGLGSEGDPAFTISANHCHGVACFKAGQGDKAGGIGYSEYLAPTLSAADSGTNRTPALLQDMVVRRLTPRECERLQGFPDDYTLIPYRGGYAKDGPRYKAIGNSMAVPVMRWIGERIQQIDNESGFL